ncbi:MAG: sigma-70 family RNA polymerase sigma factor [Patescibacteria group bacterium]|nr:sigma-70 family RNA polymerase sigma factor [Patescibacteria group bacterium]
MIALAITNQDAKFNQPGNLWKGYWANPKDENLRNQLVEHNVHLVDHVVKRCFFQTHSPLNAAEDLRQEGVFGLIRAVEKYDPKKGMEFSTYAYRWIYRFIQRHLERYEHPLRIPSYIQPMIDYFKKAERLYAAKYGQPAKNVQELSSFLEIDESLIINIRKYAHQTVYSLDGKVDSENTDSASLIDFVKTNEAGPEEICLERERLMFENEQLEQVLKCIPPKAQEMMMLSVSGYSMEEIGESFGVTRERVRQIINSGIALARAAANYKGDQISLSEVVRTKPKIVKLRLATAKEIKNFIEQVKKVQENILFG